MIYKKLRAAVILLFVLLILPIFSLPQNVLAQEGQLLPVSCFADGLYEFQSVSVSLGPIDNVLSRKFSGGDIVQFGGNVENKNSYPVVDGYIFARVSRHNENYLTEGYNIVDEFFVAEKIIIDANSKTPVNFSWTIPENLPSDDYRIDYYFSVDKRFNLGGLSFSNEIIAGFVKFEVENHKENAFHLNRTKTVFNDESYTHIGSWPFISTNSTLNIQQPIENLTDQDLQVDVSYELYYWDSIKNENLIETKRETVTIAPQSEEILTYETDRFDTSVGYLKITAEHGGVKSIVNVRFATELNDTRINYAALDKFPLNKGDEFNIFTCVYNTGGTSSDNTISLRIRDEKGRIVAEGQYVTDLSTNIDGYKINQVAEADYQFLTLETTVEDSSGKLLTSYRVDYDCSILNSESCMKIMQKEYDSNILLYGLIAMILLILIIVWIALRKKGVKNNVVMPLLCLLLILTSISLISNLTNKTKFAVAQISLDETIQSVTKSNSNNSVGWDDRILASGLYVNRALNGQLYSQSNGFDPNNAEVGDIFYVKVSAECTFGLIGGIWNTPNCGEVQDIKDGSRVGKIIMSNIPYGSSIDFDSSKVSCVEHQMNSANSMWKCTILDGGSINIGASIAAGDSTLRACVTTDRTDPRSTVNNTANNNPGCGGGTASGRIGFDNDSGKDRLALAGNTFNWNLTVRESSPVPGQCGIADDGSEPIRYYENSIPQSHLCASGRASTVTVDSSGNHNVYTWHCSGLSGSNVTDYCSNGQPHPFGDDENWSASISCVVTPAGKTKFDVDESITVTAVLNSQSGADLSGMVYEWDGSFFTDGNRSFGSTVSGNSLNNNFSTPGTYFADVVGVFAGRTVGPATCVAGTVNRGIVVSDVPNITFEINPNIGNDAGLCKASWTVSEGATSTCMIVTEFDERAEWLNSGNPFRGPAEGEQELPAGNEYRLKCTTQDSEETIISESHICIDPNLLEI